MTEFHFTYGPSLLAGPGSAGRIAEVLPARSILFVTDRQLVSLGIADAAIARLRGDGRNVVLFDAVEADPSRSTLEAAVALGRSAQVDAVIGFGGGSPMDVAKLAAYLLGSGDDLDQIWGVGNARGKRLPLVLVPTTAGTGSEATPVAIITLDGGEKRGVSSSALVADTALLDATLTTGLPRAVTAATGIDAMVHAIEAFTSAHLKNPVSDLLAREALHRLAANLLRACDAPDDLVARSEMLLGAHLAGVAFANAPVGGVHALAYPLGGRFHVPHGLSNALMLTAVLDFNMPAAEALYAELAPVIDPALSGMDEAARAQGLLASLGGMIAATGLPRRLTALGIGQAELPGLAADAMLQQRLLKNNPRSIAQSDAQRLYEAVL